MNRFLRLIATLILASAVPSLFAQSTSHPTLWPLPEISERPLGNGPNYFVDPVKGNDAAHDFIGLHGIGSRNDE